MPTSQEQTGPYPPEVVRSVELLSSDPTQYGKVLAQAAFDHFVASRMEAAASSDTAESGKA